jgi:hypothetical protein
MFVAALCSMLHTGAPTQLDAGHPFPSAHGFPAPPPRSSGRRRGPSPGAGPRRLERLEMGALFLPRRLHTIWNLGASPPGPSLPRRTSRGRRHKEEAQQQPAQEDVLHGALDLGLTSS